MYLPRTGITYGQLREIAFVCIVLVTTTPLLLACGSSGKRFMAFKIKIDLNSTVWVFAAVWGRFTVAIVCREAQETDTYLVSVASMCSYPLKHRLAKRGVLEDYVQISSQYTVDYREGSRLAMPSLRLQYQYILWHFRGTFVPMNPLFQCDESRVPLYLWYVLLLIVGDEAHEYLSITSLRSTACQ
ncbi:hypothetical protein GQX74_008363 [Glossina fuscipes]|nr:hypothetical protein GQX74_008363 [Glossina fuscipes]